MKILLLFSLLSVPAFAQKAIEPIRVSLIERQADCAEFSRAFREELRHFPDVAVVTRRVDFEVHIAAARLLDDDGVVFGYAATLLVVRGKDKYHSIYVGRSEALLAHRVVAELNARFLEPKRGYKAGK